MSVTRVKTTLYFSLGFVLCYVLKWPFSDVKKENKQANLAFHLRYPTRRDQEANFKPKKFECLSSHFFAMTLTLTKTLCRDSTQVKTKVRFAALRNTFITQFALPGMHQGLVDAKTPIKASQHAYIVASMQFKDSIQVSKSSQQDPEVERVVCDL